MVHWPMPVTPAAGRDLRVNRLRVEGEPPAGVARRSRSCGPLAGPCEPQAGQSASASIPPPGNPPRSARQSPAALARGLRRRVPP